MSCLHEAEIHFSAGTPISIAPTLSLVPCSLLVWSIFPTQQLLTGLNWIKRYTWMYWFIIGPRNPKITSWKTWPFSCAVPWFFSDFSVKLLVVFLHICFKRKCRNQFSQHRLSFGMSLFWICKYFSLVRILNKPLTSVEVRLVVGGKRWKQVAEHAMFYPPIWEHPQKRGCYSSCPVQMLPSHDPKTSGCFKLHGVRLTNNRKVVPNFIRNPPGEKKKFASIINPPSVVLDQSFWPTSTTSPGEVGWLKTQVPNIFTTRWVCWSGEFTMNTNHLKQIPSRPWRFFLAPNLHALRKIEHLKSNLPRLYTWTSTNKSQVSELLVSKSLNFFDKFAKRQNSNQTRKLRPEKHPWKLRKPWGSHCEVVPFNGAAVQVKAHCDASEMHDFDFGWPRHPGHFGTFGRVGTSS